MPIFEEWYDQPSDDSDRIISLQQTAQFQAEIVWPAMNSLCQVDLPREAVSPADSFYMSKLFGDYYYRLEMGFEEPDDSGSQDDDLYIYASLTVSRRRDDLLEELVWVRNQDQIDLTRRNPGQMDLLPETAAQAPNFAPDDIAQEEAEAYVAWETRRYYFSPIAEQVITMETYYELTEVGGTDTLWSTNDCASQSTNEIMASSYSVEEDFETSLTAKDLALIRKGFSALGVHPVLLEWAPPDALD